MKVRREPLGCVLRENDQKKYVLLVFAIIDEDLKEIGVTPIESLFANIKLDQYGTGDESTFSRRRPNNLEGEELNEKIDKSGFGEVKTLTSDEPTLLDFKDFNYVIVL